MDKFKKVLDYLDNNKTIDLKTLKDITNASNKQTLEILQKLLDDGIIMYGDSNYSLKVDPSFFRVIYHDVYGLPADKKYVREQKKKAKQEEKERIEMAKELENSTYFWTSEDDIYDGNVDEKLTRGVLVFNKKKYEFVFYLNDRFDSFFFDRIVAKNKKSAFTKKNFDIDLYNIYVVLGDKEYQVDKEESLLDTLEDWDLIKKELVKNHKLVFWMRRED